MCGVALELAKMHGRQFAAAFLADNDIEINVAINLLARADGVRVHSCYRWQLRLVQRGESCHQRAPLAFKIKG